MASCEHSCREISLQEDEKGKASGNNAIGVVSDVGKNLLVAKDERGKAKQ